METLAKVIALPVKMIARNSQVFPAQREKRDLTEFAIMRKARPYQGYVKYFHPGKLPQADKIAALRELQLSLGLDQSPHADCGGKKERKGRKSTKL